ncbi:hypothetical protein CDD83_1342 [Cordyceps sp. RAO-2017]|nr:hypothetical protein CDD83_1342 [Cordyceps sp. RAO-2017]
MGNVATTVLHRYGVLLLLLAATWLAWKRHNRRQAERRFAAEHGCRPPRPWSARWPLGLDLLVKAFQHARQMQILAFFLDVVEQSGTTFEQRLLGARGIGTVDPRNIEAILSTNFDDYSLGLRAPTFRPVLGSGIFTQDGAAWKQSRQLLRPQFASNRLQTFNHLKECVQRLVGSIPRDGVVDLQPLCFK